MSDPWKADGPIKEENIINESERDSANPANDEYKLVKLEDSGRLSPFFTATQMDVKFYNPSGSPHTWTKPGGLKYVIVEVQAGGGGGGRTRSSSYESASGGGGGAYCRKKILASELSATETVTVGIGGLGGKVSGSTSPQDGGTSSFGTHCTATGGVKGVNSSGALTQGESGGVATGGDLNINGSPSSVSQQGQGVAGRSSIASAGGNSFMGVPRYPNYRNAGSLSTVGPSGIGYGAGGGGATNGDDINERNGGDGAPGIVIVYEYF